jgi:hypothetical protein
MRRHNRKFQNILAYKLVLTTFVHITSQPRRSLHISACRLHMHCSSVPVTHFNLHFYAFFCPVLLLTRCYLVLGKLHYLLLYLPLSVLPHFYSHSITYIPSMNGQRSCVLCVATPATRRGLKGGGC